MEYRWSVSDSIWFSSRLYSCKNELSILSDGQSANVYSDLNYKYEHWTVWTNLDPGPASCHTYETWSLDENSNINNVYFGYAESQPKPSFQPIEKIVGNNINAVGSSSTLLCSTNDYSGAGWEIGNSVTLEGNWKYAQVTLGGSFQLSASNSYSNDYTIQVQKGRYVLASQWNQENSLHYGMVLTFQNAYWAQSIDYSSKYNFQGGYVDNSNALAHDPAVPSGYSEFVAHGNGDMAGLVADVGNNAGRESANGHIYLHGHSVNEYTSQLYVYTSIDNIHWNFVKSLSVASGSYGQDSYIDCGSGGTFNYLQIRVYNYDGSHPSDLCIDSVWVVEEGNLAVGASSTLASVASATTPSFPLYYDKLGLANPLSTVTVTQASDDAVYAGVASGQFDVGFVDRLPVSG